MRPPGFWHLPPQSPGWRARLLSPIGSLSARITARRLRRPGYRANVPVICVGNISLGGTGKTPTVIALLERLGDAGVDAHVVSRGYGGSETGPLRVDPARHNAERVGDEPLMLASLGTVWVARERHLGVRSAERGGAQAVLLDDGMQNPSIEKSASIVVVDADVAFGNGRVVPAGPLREPVSAGLSRADALLSIGDEEAHRRFVGAWGDVVPVPIARGELRPLLTGLDLTDQRVLAFAGIGRPQKFFSTLRGLGAELVRAEALDDHQPLRESLLKRLLSDATALGAQLVTTEKDAARLSPAFRRNVLTLPVRLELEDWSPIDAVLARAGLNGLAGSRPKATGSLSGR
ncbi:MAG: tetraacyldisaccharide 4'-kinase [Rhodobacter sp.]|nr:tetraacyldisaccharide 4'-kinase [Rhodobacter sp.]MCY4167540.1 tetraacyldisaccharide 4'-kinase [Rhodobacter sp.]MCY4241631.1 tetraacyldisaccharide 4'-kinase [Rhodobacter sp.]